jgi:hypothetical protein
MIVLVTGHAFFEVVVKEGVLLFGGGLTVEN